MANHTTIGSTRQSDDIMDDENDDKDDTKRKSRNLSEKKRRDQFNMLVNELGSMVTTNTRKMDKSTVLRSTILFLKNHNEIAVRSRVHEIQEDWKPSFLSNDEFTHLVLEALDGFIIVLSSNGRIYYASESVTSLLGYLPSELANATIYEITYQEDQSHLYNVLLNPANDHDQCVNEENQVSFSCHIRRGGLDFREETTYELVQFVGYFRLDTDIESLLPNSRFGSNVVNDTKLIFVGTGRLQTPQLIRDMSLVDSAKSEFTSRHSLEWKFLFLDHRAPPIIGYLPFEVLGTSGYDYYHVDDLDKVVTCHESLMQKGEGTSCYYRFLTKGQQWIWLKTRFYIDYNQWNSKPEFIVCTHSVVSYTDVLKQFKAKSNDEAEKTKVDDVSQSATNTRLPPQTTCCQVRSSTWSPKSSKPTKSTAGASRLHYHGGGSDATSVSAGSQSSRQSISTTHSSKPRVILSNTIKARTTPEPPPKNRRQTEIDQSSPSYMELQRFTTEPVLPVVHTSFVSPSCPMAAIALPNTVIMNQQNITAVPNNMQDELQKKHEELQQLIVHQQEELRRVSEQLLIARYGILSPLINSGLSYNASQGQSAASRNNSPSRGEITSNLQSNNSIQGMNVLPVPSGLCVPLVSMDPFLHSTTLSVNDMIIPQGQQQGQQQQQQEHQQQRHQEHQQQRHQEHQQQRHQEHQQQRHQEHQQQRHQEQEQQQQQQQHQKQQPQQHQELEQFQSQYQQIQKRELHQHQPQQVVQDEHVTSMLPFQTCSQGEIPYPSVDMTSNMKSRLNR